MTALDIIRLNRSEGLGSSDAKRIVEGDWHDLYMEKVGLKEPVDLSLVFRVQLGIHTERFHLDWQAMRHNVIIEESTTRHYHPEHSFLFAHLDGWIPSENRFVEAKHSSSRASLREKAVYYMPQLQHALAVTDTNDCYFSLIAGNDEPEWCVVERNEDYIEQLIDMETSFWWHVENRVPPEITPSGTQAQLQKLGKEITIDGLRAYDMEGHNEWASHAADFIETREAAARFDKAKSSLKELVPADASECTGHGITITRNKRGALLFK